MTEDVAAVQNDDMAKRIPYQFVETGRSEKRGAGRLAKGIEWDVWEDDDGLFRARFATPGKALDYSRTKDGRIKTYATREEAEVEAMRAAIHTFNQPREFLRSGSLINRRVAGETRPARMKHTAAEALAIKAGLNKPDLGFLLDKRTKRIMDWLDGAEDIPTEIGLLLAVLAEFPEAVQFAFDYINARLDEAETAASGQNRS